MATGAAGTQRIHGMALAGVFTLYVGLLLLELQGECEELCFAIVHSRGLFFGCDFFFELDLRITAD